jgi:hypothetical protein
MNAPTFSSFLCACAQPDSAPAVRSPPYFGRRESARFYCRSGRSAKQTPSLPVMRKMG